METQPPLPAALGSDPLAPQDHTQGTQQSKSCLCNNSV